jgi:hypothetical protein
VKLANPCDDLSSDVDAGKRRQRKFYFLKVRSRTLSARCLAYTLRAFPRDGTITQFRMTQITSAMVRIMYERDVELVSTACKEKGESFMEHVGDVLDRTIALVTRHPAARFPQNRSTYACVYERAPTVEFPR